MTDDLRDRDAIAAALAAATGQAVVETGALSRNHFSFLFRAQLASGLRVMVKVPKTDLRQRSDGLLALTSADRALGRAEFDSLTFLQQEWQGDDVNVRWVRPVAYLAPFNAVVTEWVEADEVCERYRARTLRQWLGNRSAGRELTSALAGFGTALAHLHQRHGRPLSLPGEPMAVRLDDYARRLISKRGPDPVLRGINLAASRIAGECWDTLETPTLKGIDIRNVLEDRSGSTWLLDPGKIKCTAREADLARFLLTWRILFWGTPWFAFGARPHPAVEGAFVAAYWQDQPHARRAMYAYELKETLKHWLTALDSLAIKMWPRPITSAACRGYIDPFYRHQVERLLRALA